MSVEPDIGSEGLTKQIGTWDPTACHTGALHVLRYLDLYDDVRTNRLLLAIGAGLLGKRVEFHPNSYFKNRAVYEFSLRDRFPHMEWAKEDGPGDADTVNGLADPRARSESPLR